MERIGTIGLARERAAVRVELMLTAALICAFAGLVGFEYTSFRAGQEAARSRTDLRRILPAADDYFADNGTYRGMTLERLRAGYDTGLPTSRYALRTASADGFCVETVTGTQRWHASGPSDEIAHGRCPAR
jgi:type II secretory pathway pseudopilin PulG